MIEFNDGVFRGTPYQFENSSGDNNSYVYTEPWPWVCPKPRVEPFTITTSTICACGGKSAREKVQEEILNKMAEAVENDDLKKARELAKLAKALKEM